MARRKARRGKSAAQARTKPHAAPEANAGAPPNPDDEAARQYLANESSAPAGPAPEANAGGSLPPEPTGSVALQNIAPAAPAVQAPAATVSGAPSTGLVDLDRRMADDLARDRRRKMPRNDLINDVLAIGISLSNAVVPFFRYRGVDRSVFRYSPHLRVVIDLLTGNTSADEVAFRRAQAEAHDHIYVEVPPGYSLVEVRDETNPAARIVALREVLEASWGPEFATREPRPVGLCRPLVQEAAA